MFNATAQQLNAIRTTIASAKSAHTRWVENLHRVLACGLPPAENDLAEDAHLLCGFGQWLYNRSNDQLRELPSFVKLAELHQALHETARNILRKLKASGRVSTDDYDVLIGEIERFGNAISALDDKIVHTLQTIDSLTGALNHAQLLDDLRNAQQQLDTQPCSLLRIEIDVKGINRTHGHETGDRLLHTCVKRIAHRLPKGGQIYRYSGAEFIICQPGATEDDARTLMDRLLSEVDAAINEILPDTDQGPEIHQGLTQLKPDIDIALQLDKYVTLSNHPHTPKTVAEEGEAPTENTAPIREPVSSAK